MELPIVRNGEIIPYDQVVAQLNDDAVSAINSLGKGLFRFTRNQIVDYYGPSI